MELYGSGHRSKAFLVRLILGAATGQSPEDFAEQELVIIEERMNPPKICEHGLPRGCCAQCADAKNRAEYEALAAMTDRSISALEADLTAPDPWGE